MSEHAKEPSEVEIVEKPRNGVMVTVQAAFGIVVTTLVLVLGSAVLISWRAAVISTQLEIVVKQTSDLGMKQTAEQTVVQGRLATLELWQRGIDSIGSPALNKRLEDQVKLFSDLRREFDIFKATEARKP
jgi:hypothetical protein